MLKKVLIPIVIIAVILVALRAYRYGQRDKPFILSGTIESRDIEVGSLIGGRVESVDVREGDHVVSGQTLVRLQTDLIELQIEEQKAQIDQARATLAKVQKGSRVEDIARARKEWENAVRERDRLKALFNQGIIARQQYDDAATKAATLEDTYRELQHGNMPEDIQAAQAALAREEQRLAYLNRQREEMIIKAPASGTVQSLDLRPGDLVAANQPVAKILEPSHLWVRVYVPEPKLGAVKLGQSVSVTVDTYPDRHFAGKIVEISNQGEYTPRNIQTLDQRYEQVFGVKIAIDPVPELKPGMAALVQL